VKTNEKKTKGNKKVSYRKQIARQHCVTENFGHDGAVFKLEKIFLSSSLITMQYLVPVCYTMWAHVCPKKIRGCWSWEFHSLGMEIVPDPVLTRHSPHMCYRTELGRPRSNGMSVGRGPEKFQDAGVPIHWVWRGWPLETRPSPLCYLDKCGRFRSDGIRA